MQFGFNPEAMFPRRKDKGYGGYESVQPMATRRHPRTFSTWRTIAMIVLVIAAVAALTWWLYVEKSGV